MAALFLRLFLISQFHIVAKLIQNLYEGLFHDLLSASVDVAVQFSEKGLQVCNLLPDALSVGVLQLQLVLLFTKLGDFFSKQLRALRSFLNALFY